MYENENDNLYRSGWPVVFVNYPVDLVGLQIITYPSCPTKEKEKHT